MKFLALNNGAITEVQSGAAGGAGDANKIPSLDANGRLPEAMLPTGVGADIDTIQATEALAAGDFVNIYDVTGAARIRKADASNGREAHGFVLAGVANGAPGTVYRDGANGQLSGLTIGAQHFLSATVPGQATTTVPTTAGQIVQALGVASSATRLNYDPKPTVTLA